VSQCKDIKAHLTAGHSLTALEALQRFGCFRLAARINDLRAEGMKIGTRMIEENGKVYAQYYLTPFTLEFSP